MPLGCLPLSILPKIVANKLEFLTRMNKVKKKLNERMEKLMLKETTLLTNVKLSFMVE